MSVENVVEWQCKAPGNGGTQVSSHLVHMLPEPSYCSLAAVTPPHLLLQLSCGSHAAVTKPPPPPLFSSPPLSSPLSLLSSCFGHSLCATKAGLSLVSSSYPTGHSPVPKYHMFLHVEHINNFLPVIHWHRSVYLSPGWLIGCEHMRNEWNAQAELGPCMKKQERKAAFL